MSGAEYQHPSSEPERRSDPGEEDDPSRSRVGHRHRAAMTTKIIITPASHGTVKGAAVTGTPRTVRVVTVGAPPAAGRTAQTKTVMTVPLPAQPAAGRGPVRTIFKRVYSTSSSSSSAESAASLPVLGAPPRKRQRLDHLTADQKNQRRLVPRPGAPTRHGLGAPVRDGLGAPAGNGLGAPVRDGLGRRADSRIGPAADKCSPSSARIVMYVRVYTPAARLAVVL